jgi:hypothetical protein
MDGAGNPNPAYAGSRTAFNLFAWSAGSSTPSVLNGIRFAREPCQTRRTEWRHDSAEFFGVAVPLHVRLELEAGSELHGFRPCDAGRRVMLLAIGLCYDEDRNDRCCPLLLNDWQSRAERSSVAEIFAAADPRLISASSA